MKKEEKEKARSIVDRIGQALRPEHAGLAKELDRLFGTIRHSQSEQSAMLRGQVAYEQSKAAFALAAARKAVAEAEAKAKAELDAKAVALASELQAKFNADFFSEVTPILAEQGQLVNQLNKLTKEFIQFPAVKIYLFADGGPNPCAVIAAWSALADWAEAKEEFNLYHDTDSDYVFVIYQEPARSPTNTNPIMVCGMPQAEYNKMVTGLPLKKVIPIMQALRLKHKREKTAP